MTIMFSYYSLYQLLVPTPEINLNNSDVYYIPGSSLVLACQMILLSGNIDKDTVAVFELKSSFTKPSFVLKILNYPLQENIHVQVLLMML